MTISFLATSTDPHLIEEVIVLQSLPEEQSELLKSIVKQRELTRTLRTTINDEDCIVEVSHTNYLDEVGLYIAHVSSIKDSEYVRIELYVIGEKSFDRIGKKTIADKSILNKV